MCQIWSGYMNYVMDTVLILLIWIEINESRYMIRFFVKK